jgi:glycosyltransferase involved in cell wall biosynthesis
MSHREHNIHILTRRLPSHGKYHEVINGVNEWRYDYNSCNYAAFIKATWTNTKRLFEFLQQKYQFECINFHQPFSALGINYSKMSTGVPKIYTCHSLSFEEFSSRNAKQTGFLHKAVNYLQMIVRKKIEKNGLSKSNEIVTLSKFTQEKITEIYNIANAKIKIIPGGVDLGKFHPAIDKAKIRARLNFPQDIVALFTVRNLVPRMGLENLIIAFNEIAKNRSDTQLIIGGRGPLEKELIALARNLEIEDKVHFAGFISEDELPLYYQIADLFVLPTTELEGFGLVTLEAMASGLPVIGTPIGGTKEILGQFNDDFLFDDTQSDSIAKLALEKYYIIKNNPQRWRQISEQCRKFVEEHYSWKQNIDSLEQLFYRHAER